MLEMLENIKEAKPEASRSHDIVVMWKIYCEKVSNYYSYII